MGLISDRKNKKREQFQNSVNVVGGNSTSGSLGSFHPSAFHHHHGGGGGPGHPPPHLIPTQHRMSGGGLGKGKKGIFGPQVLPAPQGTPHGLHPHHHSHHHHHPQLGGFGGGGGIQSRSGRGGSSTSLHHSHHHQPQPSGPGGLQKYPAGYYTTPVHHTSGGGGSGNASWSHPSAGSAGGGGGGGGVRSAGSQNQLHHAGNNPRYQTWVAPRKQPALSQLVSGLKDVIDGLRDLDS